MSMGGGMESESVQNAVIQYTDPLAAIEAANIQARAAESARQASATQMSKAIGALRDQYQVGRNDLQSYRTEGYTALNELNAYMGLNAVAPGAAPIKPEDIYAWNPDKYDMEQYVKNNSYVYNVAERERATGNWNGDPNLYTVYTGEGAQYDGWSQREGGKGSSGLNIIGLNGGIGNFQATDAGNAAAQAASRAKGIDILSPDQQQAIKDYLKAQYVKENEANYTSALNTYNQQKEEYDANMDIYNRYQEQGPYSAEQVMQKISSTPGYQFNLNQGLDGLQRKASASGILNSGRALQALQQYGADYATQEYGNTLSRLASLAGMGQQSAAQTSQTSNQLGQNQAQGYQALGDTFANSYLAAGQARAQGLIDANQRFKTMETGRSKSSGGGGGIGSLLSGAGSLISAFGGFSDRNLKEYVSTPTKQEILDNVQSLNIDRWIYSDIPQIHIGPYAQEFSEAFGVGDGKTINMLDAVGVLFATVKALAQEVKELKGGK